MPVVKLTVKAVEKLIAPDPSGKQVAHWDAELKGSASCAAALELQDVHRAARPSGQSNAARVHGRRAGVIRYANIHGSKHRPWLTALLARRPTKVVAIALANKIARMAWAMMAKGERYREPVALAA